jgi:hypothetical protein
VPLRVLLRFLLLLLDLTTILDNDEAGILGNALGLLLNLVDDAHPLEDFPCARPCSVSRLRMRVPRSTCLA